MSSPADSSRQSPLPDGLARYRALEAACREMLEAATSDDWDEVERIERSARALIEAIREAGPDAVPAGAARREKFGLLRSIVQLDGRIRQLAQPWQRDLDALLSPRIGTTGARGRRA